MDGFGRENVLWFTELGLQLDGVNEVEAGRGD